MKKEYDFKKLEQRPEAIKVDPGALKIQLNIQLDGAVLVELKTEADRIGIPYATFISSLLHRYAYGELMDRKTVEIAKLLKLA